MDEVVKAKTSPWHEGELTLQRAVGAVDMMASVGQRQLARTWMRTSTGRSTPSCRSWCWVRWIAKAMSGQPCAQDNRAS